VVALAHLATEAFNRLRSDSLPCDVVAAFCADAALFGLAAILCWQSNFLSFIICGLLCAEA